MTKKRSAKKSVYKPITLADMEGMIGYHLWLQRAKPMETQLSFADFLSGWSATSDPIIAMQHERLLTEIDELDCRTGIVLIDRGVKHDDGRGTTLVVVENDEAGILLTQPYNVKVAKKQLHEIMKIVLTIEDVLGFKTYDPQLGHEVDIRADMPKIRAHWRKQAAKD
jgi:hypothetical protein